MVDPLCLPQGNTNLWDQQDRATGMGSQLRSPCPVTPDPSDPSLQLSTAPKVLEIPRAPLLGGFPQFLGDHSGRDGGVRTLSQPLQGEEALRSVRWMWLQLSKERLLCFCPLKEGTAGVLAAWGGTMTCLPPPGG